MSEERTGKASVKSRRITGWLSGPLIVVAFSLVWLFERRRPLRRSVEPLLRHTGRNFAVGALAAASLQFFERPFIQPLTSLVETRKLGLLKMVRLPAWLEVPLAVVLMDYTLYLWHVLMHRLPRLWRFHLPHHVDLDLDASTALRFHAGELAIATGWRVGQVVIIGVSPLSLTVWQTFLMVSILFHHSNIRLPIAVERKLNRVFVTPRMHGVHHSIVKEETNSNWSSGLTIWDWLHGTLRLNVPQDEITIGVPPYREPNEVLILDILKMPFVAQRPVWLLPGDGQLLSHRSGVAPTQLQP